MNEEKLVVELNHLTIRYGRFTAVDDVTFSIAPGAVYALLGRNGAGKSSLVRCLLGLQRPEHGESRIFSMNAWKNRTKIMSRIGIVPEQSDAPPDMNATEILAFYGRLYPRWDLHAAMKRLERFEVPMKTPFGKLSKGQMREVLLSAALASEPELLILDDPTLGLDAFARRELFEELIGELADRGITVFVTTHDLLGIERIADRVGILRGGKLVLDEDLEAMKWRFRRIRYATPVVATPAEIPGLSAIEVRRWGNGIEAIVTDFEDLALERFRTAASVRDVEVLPMSLEEIFVAVAGVPAGH